MFEAMDSIYQDLRKLNTMLRVVWKLCIRTVGKISKRKSKLSALQLPHSFMNAIPFEPHVAFTAPVHPHGITSTNMAEDPYDSLSPSTASRISILKLPSTCDPPSERPPLTSFLLR